MIEQTRSLFAVAGRTIRARHPRRPMVVNAQSSDTMARPLQRLLAFWGVVFLLIQQVERLYLLPEAMAIEWPLFGDLLKTLAVGFLTDLVTTVCAMAMAVLLAGVLSLPLALAGKREGRHPVVVAYRRALAVSLGLIAVCLLAASTADMCYYGYNHQHLDFVFFEYVDEMFHAAHGVHASQAAEQTSAELSDTDKWIFRIGSFLSMQACTFAVWWTGFRRGVAPLLIRWQHRHPYAMTLVFATTVGSGAAGLSPLGVSLTDVIPIQSETYYSLAQSPVLFAQQPLRDAVLSEWTWTPATLPVALDRDEAIESAHTFLGPGSFPFREYPLVREHDGDHAPLFNRPVNILLMFVEGLDRRYLGQEIPVRHLLPTEPERSPTIPLTPFLDRLKEDSLYFEHFFSNGVQTTRGLLATLCSAFPRQGTAVIKTRNANEYLCLPSVLRRAGYRTEMVVSLDSDLPGLRSFAERNGVDRFYSEEDVPATAARLGVGLTDGALFDFLYGRVEALQTGKAPFFLATMTSGTHHPFTVPQDHPEVAALRHEPDQYQAALRYFDLEFERFLTRLQDNGLLKDTVVLVLGDHGRHEPIGRTDVERQVGHFLAPLLIWVDPSLRSADAFRPRRVDQIVSQVDLAPTILTMNGLMPRRASFMGRDCSCLLIGECQHDNHAYLSSVYDDLVGLADPSGLWLYSFRKSSMTHADLALTRFSYPSLHEPDAALRYRQMIALYLTTNRLIEQNRMWSSNDLESQR